MFCHRSFVSSFVLRKYLFNTNRLLSNTASDITLSDRFFNAENRQRIQQRLQKNYSKPVANGEKSRTISANAATNYDHLRQAAVLVPLIDVKGVASILFTVRSSHLSMHRGEISFPGGRADEADDGLPENTALRETHEELGIEPKSVQNGDTVIHPIIGVVQGGYDPLAFTQHSHGSAAEVWTVFTRDLVSLTNRDYLSFTQFRSGFSLPVFIGGGFRIWGLTAIVLHNALKVLVPDLYRPVSRYVRPLR